MERKQSCSSNVCSVVRSGVGGGEMSWIVLSDIKRVMGSISL